MASLSLPLPASRRLTICSSWASASSKLIAAISDGNAGSAIYSLSPTPLAHSRISYHAGGRQCQRECRGVRRRRCQPLLRPAGAAGDKQPLAGPYTALNAPTCAAAPLARATESEPPPSVETSPPAQVPAAPAPQRPGSPTPHTPTSH